MKCWRRQNLHKTKRRPHRVKVQASEPCTKPPGSGRGRLEPAPGPRVRARGRGACGPRTGLKGSSRAAGRGSGYVHSLSFSTREVGGAMAAPPIPAKTETPLMRGTFRCQASGCNGCHSHTTLSPPQPPKEFSVCTQD